MRGMRLTSLEKMGRDLTEEARQGRLEPLIGREKELERVIQTLLSRTKPNPALIGEPGVGKTALVEGLAYYISFPEKAPARLRLALKHLKVKRVIELPVMALSAGSGVVGKLEERLQDIIRELEECEGATLLFIDEVHMLMGTGAHKGLDDAANLFKPALSRGQFPFICATTDGEYQQYIMQDPALERRLTRVYLAEPGPAETVQILEKSRPRLEKHYGLEISPEVARQAVELAAECLPGRRFPDKAIDLLDQAACRALLNGSPVQTAATTAPFSNSSGNAGPPEDGGALPAYLSSFEDIFPVLMGQSATTSTPTGLSQALSAELEETFRAYLPGAGVAEQAATATGLKVRPRAKPVEQPKARRGRPVLNKRQLYETVAAMCGLPEMLLFGEPEKLAGELETRLREAAALPGEEAPELARILARRFCGGERRRKGPRAALWLAGASEAALTRLAGSIHAAVYSDQAGFNLYLQEARATAEHGGPAGGGFGFEDAAGAGAETGAETGTENGLVELDLGAYTEPHTVSQLVGSPPGYIGFEQGGQLTCALQNRPGGVVLLHRAAQAHPAVRRLLANAIASGKLVDGRGRVTPLRHFIFILTEPSEESEGGRRENRPFGFLAHRPFPPHATGETGLSLPAELAALVDFTFYLPESRF